MEHLFGFGLGSVQARILINKEVDIWTPHFDSVNDNKEHGIEKESKGDRGDKPVFEIHAKASLW